MSEETSIQVNVEEIMAEIRSNLQVREDVDNMPAFEDIPLRNVYGTTAFHARGAGWDDLEESLTYLNQNYNIPYYWVFPGGTVKVFLKRVVRRLCKCLVLPILEKQVAVNAHLVRCVNNLSEAVKEQTSVQANQKELITDMEARLFRAEEAVRNQEARMNHTEERLAQSEARLNHAEERLAQSEARLNHAEERLAQSEARLNHAEEQLVHIQGQLRQEISKKAALETRFSELEKKVTLLDRQSDDFSAAVAKTFTDSIQSGQVLASSQQNSTTATHKNTVEAAEQEESSNIYQVIDYFKFQNEFRGTRSTITERQEMYLPYFQKGHGRVLDIGCGRGEFLQLMKRNGIDAFGVDLYPEYVIEGKLNGVEVHQGDGIEYLAQTQETFGGIFVGQVIEHIDFNTLELLCKSAFEKLEEGACLVLETPNPACLSTFATSFYIDPTHSKPVHPLTLAYLLRELGFKDVKTVYTDCSRQQPLPMIQSNAIENLEQVNQGIARVSELLYGSLDYAVIAKK